jgi:hypothetical protein
MVCGVKGHGGVQDYELNAALVAQKEHESGETAAVDEMREREGQLLAALSDAKLSLSSVMRKHSDAQDKLLELQQREEGSATGAAAEAELANEELERARLRCGAASPAVIPVYLSCHRGIAPPQSILICNMPITSKTWNDIALFFGAVALTSHDLHRNASVGPTLLQIVGA